MAEVHPVRVAAAARGWSIAELARRLGLNQDVLRHVIAGRNASWPKLRRDCATLLGCSESELFPEADAGQRIAAS